MNLKMLLRHMLLGNSVRHSAQTFAFVCDFLCLYSTFIHSKNNFNLDLGLTQKMSAMKPSSARSRRDKDDTNNPDVSLPGIGNYIFQKTVGEGNFAKVKLATHKWTNAEVFYYLYININLFQVAIKVIDKTQLDEKKLGKLYREVRIMKLLHHPNIVKLYEVIETRSTVFLVMEYAAGGELYDYLVIHGKMKEKDARAKFRQILSAVSYCHKKRVIHRDLKVLNCFNM